MDLIVVFLSAVACPRGLWGLERKFGSYLRVVVHARGGRAKIGLKVHRREGIRKQTVKMAGDCAHGSYANTETFCPSEPWSDDARDGDGDAEKVEDSKPWPTRFEVRNGLLYRKKLERGFIHYREVLDEDQRHEAIGTIHRRLQAEQHHLTLEETYKCVAEHYWWEGMNITICPLTI